MEYKDFENQLQSDVIAQLKEIDAFDIIEDEQRVTVIDSCDEAVFAGYISEDPVNASVVSNGMVVDGDINSDKYVSVGGRVNGNVASAGDVKVNGLVVGDIKAANVQLNDAKLRGNSKASGKIIVDGNTIIVGNLSASDISVNSKVKGVITAVNNVDFKESALVVGDVVTGAIHMDEGSRVNASIMLTNKNAVEVSDEEFDLGV
jgi:cytoskeletal protein CcmA (bactofilin family)